MFMSNLQKAYIIGAVYLPVESVDTAPIIKDLHIKEVRDVIGTAPAKEISMYHFEEIAGKAYIAVPRAYGERFIDDYEIVDWTATGDIGCLSNLKELVPRPHQPPFIDSTEQLLREHFDIVSQAGTGQGKTVMAIEIARRLNTSTLIIVDQTKLERQWRDTLVNIFGVPDSDIGYYNGRSKEYEGKPVCIATLQTLYKGGASLADFYDTWGFTIIDENHSAGSQKYGTTLMNLSSQYRLGVSATTDRGDIFQKVLDYNLGSVAYILDAEHKESSIRYVEYPRLLSTYSNTAKQAGTYETDLASDGARNLLIANIVEKMYNQGRDILVIGSRSLQLHGLMDMCSYMGIPEEDMGIYSQSLHKAGYSKDKEPPFRLDEWDEESFYTAVEYTIGNIRSGKIRTEIQDKAIEARVIFSTYSMFGKGTDVPRLSVGIDATPRSKVVQAHGRILRTMEGKPTPIWVTIRDFNNIRSEGQFMRRLGDYAKSNATTIKEWVLGKGTRSIEYTDLKRNITRNTNRLSKLSISVLNNGEYRLASFNSRERQ